MREILIIYAVVINIIAAAAAVCDKSSARKHKWRVPESTLLILAALSGCVIMYITLHIIHHKTKKLKFMLGIPLIFVAELAAVFCLVKCFGIF